MRMAVCWKKIYMCIHKFKKQKHFKIYKFSPVVAFRFWIILTLKCVCGLSWPHLVVLSIHRKGVIILMYYFPSSLWNTLTAVNHWGTQIFPKMLETSHISRCQKCDMKQIVPWGTTNSRHHHKTYSQSPGPPGPWDVFADGQKQSQATGYSSLLPTNTNRK
jgi:hypothetical protein